MGNMVNDQDICVLGVSVKKNKTMTVSTEDLEVAFTDFVTYTKTEKKEDFISFHYYPKL